MSDEKPVDFKDNMINSIATDNNSQFSLDFNDAMLHKVADRIAGIKTDISKDILMPTSPEPESENDVQETE
jgi:hypothetical protein|tara:strand:- start:326 stop:538 length:213 start_codon:yes stop_codon:yes gene_type:complete